MTYHFAIESTLQWGAPLRLTATDNTPAAICAAISEHANETGSLEHRRFAGLNLAGLSLPVGTDLTGSSFTGTDLAGAIANGCRFDHCDLTRACLDGAQINNASFYLARAERLHADGIHAKRSRWHGARLTYASFDNADLRSAHFDNARLQDAHFVGADILCASFAHAAVDVAALAGTVTPRDVVLSQLYYGEPTPAALVRTGITREQLEAAEPGAHILRAFDSEQQADLVTLPHRT